MLIDPTGGSLQMLEVRPLLHVPEYILPGVFLLVVMGMVPFGLVYGLLARPNWTPVDRWFRWSGHYWAWTGTLALGLILMLWLLVQAVLIGFRWPIQYATTSNAILICLMILAPSTKSFYASA